MFSLRRILIVGFSLALIAPGLCQRTLAQDAPPTTPSPTISATATPVPTPGPAPSAAPAPAQVPGPGPRSAPSQVQAPVPNPSEAYYSWRMQAYFVIQTVDLSPYGWPGFRPVAQLVSPPSPYSPIARLGLRPGDMITRLDDIPIADYADLDSHYTLTKVTYLRQGFYAQQAWVDLGPLYPGVRPPVYPGRVLVDPAPYPPRPPRIVRPWPWGGIR